MQRVFDVVKKTANGVDYVIFALENQKKVHYAMPLRHMLNDALLYYREYAEIAEKNAKKKENSSSAEFLSGMRKKDRLHPMVSICVYYGEEAWDGPVCLKDMLDIPPYLEPLVSDYKMHLVQIHSSQQLQFHHKEVETVFEVCRQFYSKQCRSVTEFYQKYPITPELGVVIGTIIGSQRFINYALKNENEGGTSEMWKCVQEMEEEFERKAEARGEARGRQIGLRKGIQTVICTCREMNMKQEVVAEKLKNGFELSKDEAMAYVRQYW